MSKVYHNQYVHIQGFRNIRCATSQIFTSILELRYVGRNEFYVPEWVEFCFQKHSTDSHWLNHATKQLLEITRTLIQTLKVNFFRGGWQIKRNLSFFFSFGAEYAF